MHNTDAQLSEALTGLSVSQRTAVEAVLNHVTAIVAAEQVARLELLDEVRALRAEVAELRRRTPVHLP